ncbi:MAG: hypothetical protein AAF703_07285 [Cyanobacteria bacterium P01_D01_bin.105]
MIHSISETTAVSYSFFNDLVDELALPSKLLTILTSEQAEIHAFVGSDRNEVYQGTTGNDIVVAGGGSDALLLTAGNNLIYTTDAYNRGRLEQDYLQLGAGQDTVVLGDTAGSYYVAGGWQDSVYIENFNPDEDQLVLYGNQSLYTVQSADDGAWILFGENETTAIAFLRNVQSFELGSRAVSFIKPSEPELSEPELSEPAAATKSVDTDEALLSEESWTASEPERSPDFYAQLGIAEYYEVPGSSGDDLLIGGAQSDQLFGFAGNDYAFGGEGADLFVLGDFGGAYYAQLGWEDTVYIDDFTAGEDKLQLHGHIGQYSTEAAETGIWLYAQGDAIAFFNGIQSLDLISNVQYRTLAAL